MLIVFDLDDTLIETSTCISPYQLQQTFFSLIKAGLLVDNPFYEIKKLLTKLKKEKSARQVLKNYLVENDIDKKFLNLMDIGLTKLLPDYFEVKTFPFVKNILIDLRKKHTLCIVTRGEENYQQQKLQKTGIDFSLFSKIVVTPKDDKKIYYKDLRDEFGVENFLVCGDRVKSDLIPAKELGGTTVLTTEAKRDTWSIASSCDIVDYRIDCFKQIEKIIEKLEG